MVVLLGAIFLLVVFGPAAFACCWQWTRRLAHGREMSNFVASLAPLLLVDAPGGRVVLHATSGAHVWEFGCCGTRRAARQALGTKAFAVWLIPLASLRLLCRLASSTCLPGIATCCFLCLLELPFEVDDVLRAHAVGNWRPVVYESPFCDVELGRKDWETQLLCSNDTSGFLPSLSHVPAMRGFVAPRNG